MTGQSSSKQQKNKRSIISEFPQRLEVGTVSSLLLDCFPSLLQDMTFANWSRVHEERSKTDSWVTPHKIMRLFLLMQHMRMQKKADPFTIHFCLRRNSNRSESGIDN